MFQRKYILMAPYLLVGIVSAQGKAEELLVTLVTLDTRNTSLCRILQQFSTLGQPDTFRCLYKVYTAFALALIYHL